MRARDLKGRSIVDIGSAVEVGRVRSVIIDPDAHRVIGFVVGGDAPVLPLADVRAIGPDAVTVADPSAMRLPTTDAEERAIGSDLDPLGSPVLGDDGTIIGVVDDVEFADDGAIAWLVVDGREVAGERLLGMGDHAVVVAAFADRA